MTFEKRDNSGTLSRNDRKNQPNHPDHRGVCTIDGVEYYISAWVKDGRNGKFFSLAFQPKDEAPQQSRPQQRQQAPLPDLDDDISF